MGNVCTSDTATNRASPYCSIETGGDCKPNGMWHGTWGFHFHTMQNLIQRANVRWCRFSQGIDGYDFLKFVGGYIYIPQNQDLNFMFNADPFWMGSILNKNDSEKDKEETWIHPGYMMHAPGTHWILSRRLLHRRGLYKIKIKPPSHWESYTSIKGAFDWILWLWYWTWWDPERAFFNPCGDNQSTECAAEPWWAMNNDKQNWVDRSQYQKTQPKNWGPFLPQVQCSGNSSSFWFYYKLKIKLGGESLWTPVPRNPITQGFIPSAPGFNGDGGQVQPHTITAHRQPRPWTHHDLLPFDLDSDGIVTDEALERITRGTPEDGPPVKRRKLERGGKRPPKYLSRRAQHILLELLRKREHPTSITQPSHNIP